MFGKLMSISDTLMWRYYELLSFRSLDDIAVLKAATEAGRNPRDAKVELAQEIVARFHGAQAGRDALAEFEARFRDGAMPEDMPEVTLAGAPLGILKVLREAGLAASGAEAQRNVEQGGVRVNGEKGGRQIVAIVRGRLRDPSRKTEVRACYLGIVGNHPATHTTYPSGFFKGGMP